MKNWLLLSALSLACCGILALLSQANGETGAPPARTARAALKIAVVDMGQILQQYKRADEVRDEVKAASDASNAKLQDLVRNGQDLIKSLKDDALDPASKEFRERETKIFQAESYAKAYKSSAEKELQRGNLKASVEIYNDIQDVLKLFSEQNGFTVILRVDNEARSTTDFQAISRVISQDVIYHNSRDDITTAVVAYLNRRYESSAKRHETTAGDGANSPSSKPTNSPSSTTRKANSR